MPFSHVEATLASVGLSHPELRCCPTVTGLRRVCKRERIHVGASAGRDVSLYDFDGEHTLLIGRAAPRDILAYEILRALALHATTASTCDHSAEWLLAVAR